MTTSPEAQPNALPEQPQPQTATTAEDGGASPVPELTEVPQPKNGHYPQEEALLRALTVGPVGLPRQINHILTLSNRIQAAQNSNYGVDKLPPPQKPLTIQEARLTTLVGIAHTLDAAQLRRLYRDIRKLDERIRVKLLIQLAGISPSEDKHYLTEFRDQSEALQDPLAKSEAIFALLPLVIAQATRSTTPETPDYLQQIADIAEKLTGLEARVRAMVTLAEHLPSDQSERLLSAVLDEINAARNDRFKANTLSAIAPHLPPTLDEKALEYARNIDSPAERARAMTLLSSHIAQSLQTRQAALDAISLIESEEERVQAFETIVPQLESASETDGFSEVLEQALAISVLFSKRQLRARALAALAPHLTLDLQGEALAAVHTISSERERANLLSQLAPTLPPNMLVASLAVAHTMMEQDARVQALTTLAHYVPPHARAQTVLDTVAAASNLTNQSERVRRLVAVMDVLPEELREQVCNNALETTLAISNESARARAFSLIAEHLPLPMLKRALEAAYKINDVQHRLAAMMSLLPHLPEDDHTLVVGKMLATLPELTFDYKRAGMLVSLAPYMSAQQRVDGLKLVDGLEDPVDRVNAYTALAEGLPPEPRTRTIRRAWNLTRTIPEGYERSTALGAVAPLLTGREQRALPADIVACIRSIDDDYDRASMISMLVPYLAHQPHPTSAPPDSYVLLRTGIQAALEVPQQGMRVQMLRMGVPFWLQLDAERRYALWRDIAAPQLAKLPVADTLLCLGALMPVFKALIGEDRLKDIAHLLGLG